MGKRHLVWGALLVVFCLAAVADDAAVLDFDDVDTLWVAPDPWGRICGLVVAGMDVPWEGVVVEVAGESTSTDAEGLFAFEDLPAGTHVVRFSGEALAPIEVEVELGEEDHAPLFLLVESDMDGDGYPDVKDSWPEDGERW